MKNTLLEIKDVDNKTILTYSISCCITSMITLYLANTANSPLMIVVQFIIILYSTLLAFVAFRGHITRGWRISTMLFFTCIYLGMWFHLSLSHHMVLVYLLSILILNMLILRNRDRIFSSVVLLSIAFTNIVTDLYIREPIYSYGTNRVQKYGIVVSLSLGILITTGINRIAFEKAMRKITSQSLIDSLTGALNKRAFQSDLLKHKDRYERYQHNYVLVYIDLDDFKYINDKYGHNIGDEVLKETVNHIRMHIRLSDRVYRVGGDEFIVIMENIHLSQSRRVLERFLELSSFESARNLIIHFSTGIIDAKAAFEKQKDIVAYADELMYRNKIKKKTPPSE